MASSADTSSSNALLTDLHVLAQVKPGDKIGWTDEGLYIDRASFLQTLYRLVSHQNRDRSVTRLVSLVDYALALAKSEQLSAAAASAASTAAASTAASNSNSNSASAVSPGRVVSRAISATTAPASAPASAGALASIASASATGIPANGVVLVYTHALRKSLDGIQALIDTYESDPRTVGKLQVLCERVQRELAA